VIKRKFCDGQHSGAGDYGSYLSPQVAPVMEQVL
jgi:hypothetical protein